MHDNCDPVISGSPLAESFSFIPSTFLKTRKIPSLSFFSGRLCPDVCVCEFSRMEVLDLCINGVSLPA